ncbi:MAG: dynamin family protein [Lachnospiraceae bacterium]|nr:dynamin family protein [Lachnospiraceae bacterium]
MTNNPVEVAMDLAKLSVDRVAEMLGVSRQTINNYMKNPGQIPGEKIFILSQETGISMDKLYGPSKRPDGPVIASLYEKHAEKLHHFIDAAKKIRKDIDGLIIDDSQEICKNERERAVAELTDIIEGAKIKGRKPTVCAFGPSDAGKSTLINYLIGEEITPAGYSPLTTVPTYLKHVSERPAFLEDPADNAIVIGHKKGSNNKLTNYEQLLIGDIDEGDIIRYGNYKSVLEEFGTREGEYYKNSNYMIEAILVYADVDILGELTLIDIPGFGSGDDADNVGLAMDASAFDVIFFLSTADAYLRGHELVALCNTFRMRDDLSSIYLLATHTNAIGDPNEVEKIIERGCKRIVDTMADSEKARLGLSEDNYEALRTRCFPFDMASTKSCQTLNQYIETELPAIVEKRIFEASREAKKASKEYLKRYKKLADNIDKERRSSKSAEEIDAEKEKSREAQKRAADHLKSVKIKMEDSIDTKRLQCVQKMKDHYARIVDVDYIVRAIERKGLKNKKGDIEDLSNYISGEVNDGLQRIMSEKSDAFANELKNELENYQENLENDIRSFKLDIDFQGFDFTRAFAAGLAGLTTYGALAAWAIVVAQGSNLGAYILVAKVVSALSALGISVGGTATVAAFVASIGGPVTIGIALALIAAATAFGVFTGTWKKRVAKRIVDTYEDKNVLGECCKTIDSYWNDTRKALDACVGSLSAQIKDFYDEQIKAYEMTDESHIKMITILQMLYGKLHEGYQQMYENIHDAHTKEV